MSRVCESCSNILNDGDLFCSKCGAGVEHESAGNSTEHCIKCGTELKEDSDYCSMCGASRNGEPTKYRIHGPATGKSYTFKSNSAKGTRELVLGKDVNFNFTDYFLEIKIPKKYNAERYYVKYTSLQELTFKKGFSAVSLILSLIFLCVLFYTTNEAESILTIIGSAILTIGFGVGAFQSFAEFKFTDETKYKIKLRRINSRRAEELREITDSLKEMKDYYTGKPEPQYVSKVKNYGIRKTDFDISGMANDIVDKFTG